MRQKIIKRIQKILKERDSLFTSEKEIQLFIASHFIHCKLFENVFLEYHIPSNLITDYPWNNNKIYIDIVLEKDGDFYPIEIKYKTKNQDLPYTVFGESLNVRLGQQGARNIGCYNFWKDVKRIELFEEQFQNVKRGVVLFVSNDSLYMNMPNNPEVGYAQFSICDKRKVSAGSNLNWNGDLRVQNGRPGFKINYNYTINWIQLNIDNHQYVMV